MNMRLALPVTLLIVGIYFLVWHYAPLPLNHESLGLYNHGIHRIMGVVLLVVGVFLGLKARKKS